MAEPSYNGESNSGPLDTKFKPGNKFGRGNPMLRTCHLFRLQLIKELKMDRSVPLLVRRLKQMAMNGTRTVRIKQLDKETNTYKRVTVQEPVAPTVQFAAIQELLSRAVGKATEFKVIEDNRESGQVKAVQDFAKMVKMYQDLEAPEEIWPAPVYAWYQAQEAKRVESKVIEGKESHGND